MSDSDFGITKLVGQKPYIVRMVFLVFACFAFLRLWKAVKFIKLLFSCGKSKNSAANSAINGFLRHLKTSFR